MAGWSLSVDEGVAGYTYNWFGHEITTIAASDRAADRCHVVGVSLRLRRRWSRQGWCSPACSSTTSRSARGRIERTVPFLFSMSGETLDVGLDTGSPVGPYDGRFPFTGDRCGSTSTCSRASTWRSSRRSPTAKSEQRSRHSEPAASSPAHDDPLVEVDRPGRHS